LLQHEEGVGPAAAQKIITQIQKLENIEQLNTIGEVVSGKALTGWNNFLQIFKKLLDAHTESKANPGSLISALLDSKYTDYLEAEFLDSDDRIKDLEQLSDFALKSEGLTDFLSESSLQESFARPNNTNQPTEKRLVLSTIHQAKGLEWSAVFIINLANDAFPSSRALREESGLEEERRLFYVAATRAKKHLFLTYPMSVEWGDAAGPSLFFSEISQDLIDDHSLLNTNRTVFDDDIQYISEDDEKPLKIQPGSFLRSIDDL